MATPTGTLHASRRKALIADVLLFSVAIFWGSNFVFIKDVVARTTEIAAGSIVAGTMLYLVPLRGRHRHLRRRAARELAGRYARETGREAGCSAPST